MRGGGKKKRERIRLHATREAYALFAGMDGLPDVNYAKFTAQIMSRLVAEQQEHQIGADRTKNVGGETWPDLIEDGAPIMLDNIPA